MPPNFDMNAFITALSGLLHPDALGSVARSNARPGGLTPATDWASMFTPTSPGRQAQVTRQPMPGFNPQNVAQGPDPRGPMGPPNPATTPPPQAPQQPLFHSAYGATPNPLHSFLSLFGI